MHHGSSATMAPTGPVTKLATAVLCFLAAALAWPVRASDLSVYPIRIELRPERAAETVRLSNREDRPLRFEVSYQAWSMAQDGQWRFQDSDDLLVHPLLLTVPARGSATVRVGSLLPPQTPQRAWRLFLQQLPDDIAADGVQLQLLTRMSIPVFFGLGSETAQPGLTRAWLTDEALHLELDNDGDAYLGPGEMTVTVLDGSGAPLETIQSAVGYVLPDAHLTVAVPLSRSLCASGRSVRAQLTEPGIELEAAIEQDARCGR